MVSLKDIAEKCDVSVATVSKALNDQKDIGAETKRRIRTAADELGYSPNAAARALKTGQSFNLGVLFQDDAGSGLTHEYFSGVLNGFKEEAEAMGYDITFINTRFGKRKASYTEHCRSRNFDGVVVVCAQWTDPRVTELLNDSIPKVTIDFSHHRCTAISSNNEKGIEDLLRFVYDRGHRAIAYIHGQDYSYVTRDRLKSFFRTAEELNLEIPKEYIREARYLEAEAAIVETRKLLELKNPPTCKRGWRFRKTFRWSGTTEQGFRKHFRRGSARSVRTPTALAERPRDGWFVSLNIRKHLSLRELL